MTRTNGYTLIELLVGLAILGMIAAMLVAGLGTSGLMAARARTQADALEPVASAQMVLRARLERLRAAPKLTSARAVADIDGTAQSLDFTGAPPDREMPDALFRYRLAMSSAGDVTLTSTPVIAIERDDGVTPRQSWTSITLARGASGLAIAYFGDDPLSAGRSWQTRWYDRPQPPDLIRVRVAFPPGDQRRWPDLIARPRATVNNACRIDPMSGRCEGST